MATVSLILGGALAALSFVAGVFFLRYWHATRDGFFLYFTAAFWLLGANWGLAAAVGPAHEGRPFIYLLRLAAFALLAFGILHKNRRGGT